MYSNTRFGELLKGLSRGAFGRMVRHRKTDKYTKGFGSWNHLVIMLYAQIAQHSSLREVETGFNSQLGRHHHLGCRTVRRSTLSDANRKRDAGLFVEVCQHLMAQVNRKIRSELKTLLYLLDSTSMTLKGPGYDAWAKQSSTRNTQGVKLHLLLSGHDAIPHYCNMTRANVNDVTDAAHIDIEEKAIYAFDKGYCDYNWWHRIDAKGATFVTRFKNNAALDTLRQKRIPKQARDVVVADDVVKFKHKHPRARHINRYGKPLRRIVIARPDHDTPLVLATNDMKRSALDIAETYKKRWLIELFFKWIKQHLKIKTFLGRSENAVRIQLYTALIGYLLIALYRHVRRMKSSMKDVLVLISATLFQRPETEQHLMKQRRRKAQQLALQRQVVLI